MNVVAQEALPDARAANYPLARWYLRPLAGALAEALAVTRVRPWHVTCLGLCLGLTAALLVATERTPTIVAAALVLAAWLCDRTDGQLARRQRTASAFGAWLDANVDELLDVAWHVAMAFVVTQQLGTTHGFALLGAFLSGKYLFMYGLSVEPPAATEEHPSPPANHARSLLKTLYHAPANADVRVHLLIAALATGWLSTELLVVAVYYNLRWIARYALVARRLLGSREDVRG
ncbi:MAG: CDP-alcohol phosphatidyltransferase family protein [Pirellulales bacterium]|nr:CDP-alcohol phosphatidyltransferase family protein [Pirellulales bacterium]